jgi:hypothetical protein
MTTIKIAMSATLAMLALPACRRSTPPPPCPGVTDLAPAPTALDDAQAERLASLSLSCVDREYPNKPGVVIEGDDHVRPPRVVTPAFFGCFDWHSAVHGHWSLLRLLRARPKLPRAEKIRAALGGHFTPERIAAELATLGAERNRTVERPYGWAWLLRLALELRTWDDPDARRWATALAPLSSHLARGFGAYLPRLSTPVRDGTHANTAFSLVHVLDYARGVGDQELARLIEGRARDFYGADVDCPAHYEPSGEDFVSPCLAEADLMRRVLDRASFVAWLDRFLPSTGSPRFRPLACPVEVRDPKDPRIGHLIGLAFHRAWSFEGIADSLPAGDARVAAFRALAVRHLRAALAQLAGSGYGGHHWLASFAVYTLTWSDQRAR